MRWQQGGNTYRNLPVKSRVKCGSEVRIIFAANLKCGLLNQSPLDQ
jgi:hypothetical protein